MPYLTNFYGNPHSRTHAYGWESETGVENARKVNNCAIVARCVRVRACCKLTRLMVVCLALAFLNVYISKSLAAYYIILS